MSKMAIVTAAPSLDLYRTPHRIDPVLGSEGWYVCAIDRVRVYTVLGFRWQHDLNVIRRLVREDVEQAVADKCYRCGHAIPKGGVEDELAITVDLGDVLGFLCFRCQDKDAGR